MRQLLNLKHTTTAQRMLAGEYSQVMRGKKKSPLKAIVGHNKRQVNVALFKAPGQAEPAVLYKMYFYTGVPNLVLT